MWTRLTTPLLRQPDEQPGGKSCVSCDWSCKSLVEAFEASSEELKASNEEVVSINEELQSANEELETGKEELQSLNEELITVNAQLQTKVAEPEATTNDLSNLLSSTNNRDWKDLYWNRQNRLHCSLPQKRRP